MILLKGKVKGKDRCTAREQCALWAGVLKSTWSVPRASFPFQVQGSRSWLLREECRQFSVSFTICVFSTVHLILILWTPCPDWFLFLGPFSFIFLRVGEAVLEVYPTGSHMLGKCFTTGLYPQHFILKKISWEWFSLCFLVIILFSKQNSFCCCSFINFLPLHHIKTFYSYSLVTLLTCPARFCAFQLRVWTVCTSLF